MAVLRGGPLTGGFSGGGGGGGTVTSVAALANGGLGTTPNPITGAGTIRLNYTNLLAFIGSPAPTDEVAILSGGTHYRTTLSSLGGTYTRDFVQGDLTGGVLSVTHSLNQRPVLVQIYNSLWQQVTPDSVELNGVNTCLINVSTLQPLVGTYHLIVKR